MYRSRRTIQKKFDAEHPKPEAAKREALVPVLHKEFVASGVTPAVSLPPRDYDAIYTSLSTSASYSSMGSARYYG